MQNPQRNRTRRAPANTDELPSYGLNTGLEQLLHSNAADAYKRPWHRLERGLRLNRIRKFIEAETARMTLETGDVEHLTNLLHRALDRKLLNSKTAVIYDQEKQEIQEIKGLMYHKVADGRIMSQIVEKKAGCTLRRKNVKGGAQPTVVAQDAQTQEPTQQQEQSE